MILMTWRGLDAAAMATVLGHRINLAGYLARMEFSRRFSSTAGGAFWMFVGPLLTIFVIWVALDVGLSASGRFGSEFGMAVAVGLAAWLFFSDVVSSATGTIVGNPHLVKKVVFPVAVLPISSALAAFFVHVCVLGCVVIAVFMTGGHLTADLLLLPIWMGCLFYFTAALGLLLASINVRYRDTALIAPNVVSLLFWLTPLVWPLTQLTEDWQAIALLNPLAVIIQGYRSAMGMGPNQIPWFHVAIFCVEMAAVGWLGVSVYKRCRAAFSDSL